MWWFTKISPTWVVRPSTHTDFHCVPCCIDQTGSSAICPVIPPGSQPPSPPRRLIPPAAPRPPPPPDGGGGGVAAPPPQKVTSHSRRDGNCECWAPHLQTRTGIPLQPPTSSLSWFFCHIYKPLPARKHMAEDWSMYWSLIDMIIDMKCFCTLIFIFPKKICSFCCNYCK